MANESRSSHELIQAEEKGEHPGSSHDRGLLLIGLVQIGEGDFFLRHWRGGDSSAAQGP